MVNLATSAGSELPHRQPPHLPHFGTQICDDFQAKVAHQQEQIEALTAGLQKVSAQLEVSKTAPRVVNNDQ